MTSAQIAEENRLQAEYEAKVQKCESEFNTAKQDLSRCEREFVEMAGRLRKQFEASSEYAQAMAALAEAQAAYEKACAASKEALSKSAEYQTAMSAKKQAEAAVEAARNEGDTDAVTALAAKVMNCGSKARAIEASVLEASPLVKEAKARVAAARTRVKELQKKFEDSFREDPQWVAAKQALDTARSKLEAAKLALEGM